MAKFGFEKISVEFTATEKSFEKAGKSFDAMRALMNSEFGKDLFDEFNVGLIFEEAKKYEVVDKPKSKPTEKIEPPPGKRKIIL